MTNLQELQALREFADAFDDMAMEVTNRGTTARPTVKQLNDMLALCWKAKRLRTKSAA